MRLLAIETSTLAGGVALLDDDRVVGEYLLDVRVTHSERIMAAIDRVLTDAGVGIDEIDALAVAIGPGSFTGLRIGLGTVKGLALGRDLAVAAVPTLDAMAAGLPFAAMPVCPVVDARRDEVYACRYRWDGSAMRREWDYLALPPAELAARLDEPVILVGDAVRSIVSPFARIAPVAQRLPSPACVGQLGLERLARGQRADVAALAPLYLRPSQAELKRRGVPVA
jgi:tRNA threonylcarbamoyladenosine biosynthesis protein TsaB